MLNAPDKAGKLQQQQQQKEKNNSNKNRYKCIIQLNK